MNFGRVQAVAAQLIKFGSCLMYGYCPPLPWFVHRYKKQLLRVALHSSNRTLQELLILRSTWVLPRFYWGSCYSIFCFICLFCWSLFVILYFFFWPLCFLLFFDIRILIAPLVSSNSSSTENNSSHNMRNHIHSYNMFVNVILSILSLYL